MSKGVLETLPVDRDSWVRQYLLHGQARVWTFFYWPEPGENDPFPEAVYWPTEPYDDGGGATIAAIQYGACACWPT